ncbi:hypothetical protein HPB50_029334 [Hyalomma asiaticum]|nr:hypothetical protein HPB50_029334 [Hyalomma asiaticum]
MGMRSLLQNCHVRNFLKCGGGPGGRKYRRPALMTLIGEPQGQRSRDTATSPPGESVVPNASSELPA